MAGIVRFPDRIEVGYRRRLWRRLRAIEALFESRGAIRKDNEILLEEGRILAVLTAVEQAYEVAFDIEPESLLSVARAVDGYATRATQRIVGRVPAITVPYNLEPWAQENARLIRGAERDLFRDIAKAVRTGSTDLDEVVRARLGVTKHRAAVIARDQIATLNSNITQRRQTELGVTRYRWITAKDPRVRPEHAALHNRVFAWTRPHPTEGHPGEAIMCRCIAQPILDEDEA